MGIKTFLCQAAMKNLRAYEHFKEMHPANKLQLKKKKDEKTRRVSKNEPKNTENDDDKKLYFLVVQDTGGNVGKFFFPVL